MAKKVLSIIIGDEITKVCEVSYKKNYKNKGIRVYRSISFPTSKDTIEDGFIKDKAVFGTQLRQQLKVAKFKANKVIFSIASSKIANREVTIPLVKDSRINEIVQIGAGENFPVDIKDYIISYIVLEKKTSDRKDRALAKRQEKLEAKALMKQQKLENKTKKKRHTKTDSEQSEMITYKLKYDESSMPESSSNRAPVKEEKQEKKDNKSKKHIRLSVYAVPSNLVKNYYNFADIMGLKLISIDYSGNSSYQMLKRQANEGTNVFVQMNEQDTIVSILHDNVLVLQRTIVYGISSLIETVMEQTCLGVHNETEAMELLIRNNMLDMNAVEKTRKNSLSALDEAASTIEFGEAQGIPAMNPEYIARRNIVESLMTLTNSISRMLDYYRNIHKNVSFQNIYLSGFGIRIQGIEQLFTERIGISNTKLEKLYAVSSSKKAKDYRQYPSEFMACVGSVLKPVNFVPSELVQKKQRIGLIVVTTFLILLCLGGSSVLSYVAYEDYRVAKEEYKTTESQLGMMPDVSSVVEKHQKAATRLEDLKSMEAKIQTDNKISEVISELEKNMLTNAKVQSIQFSDAGIVMSIKMADNNYGSNTLVAKLLSQLKKITMFSEVQDSNMSVSDEGEVTLTISCTYKE